MRILWRCNSFKHQKILKELNKYWDLLNYEKTSKKKKKTNDMFCCNEYTFFIDRYSISIWAGKNLSLEQKNEISRMLKIIFNDKKIKGFADGLTDEQEWFLDILAEIENIHKISRDIPNNWLLSDLEECKEFVSSLCVSENDKEKKEKLLSIINTIIVNSKSIKY